jgi:hypothetical protein
MPCSASECAPLSSSTTSSETAPRGDGRLRRYGTHLLGALVLLPLLLGLANLIVDPYGAYFRLPTHAWFESGRNMRDRRPKAHLLLHGDCRVLLVGSSRVEYGIDARHPGWQGAKAYNLGMNHHSAVEIPHIVDLALAHNPVEHVVLFLDFFAFNALRGISRDFDPALYRPASARQARQSAADMFHASRFNPDQNRLAYHATLLLGFDATAETVAVVKDGLKGRPREYMPEGTRVPRQVHQSPETLFFKSMRTYRRETSLFAAYRPGAEHEAAVRRALASCHARNVAVTVVILPVHAFHLELIHSSGLWQELEGWKRRLVQMLAEEGAVAGQAPFPLWDFQGYNRFTTERVPRTTDAEQRMHSFWETSHCTQAVGDRVICRITGTPHREEPDLSWFGVLLTPATLDAHLARLRGDRVAYLESAPGQAAFFQELLQRIDAEPR